MSAPEISFVEFASSKTDTHDANALAIIERIRSDRKLELATKRIRRIWAEAGGHDNLKAAKEAVEADKKTLPAVMWSGKFKNREKPADEKLITHSGLLCADLDGLNGQIDDIKRKLLKSEYLRFLFRSPSGDGLKAVFRVPASKEKHHASYLAVKKHVEELTGGVQIDESCKDVPRLCFLSSDPDSYSNENAKELAPAAEPPKKKTASVIVGSAQIEARKKIATELLGEISWDSESHGFCTCPGKLRHTSGDADTDCELHLSGAPTLHCFHSSCSGIVEAVNRELRSQIGRAERPAADLAGSILRDQTEQTVDQLPDAIPLMTLAEREPDPSKTLLGNRFLCRGGGMLFIGPSGIGKSSASVQQDILWSLGRIAFDINPARPLRILCIQAENDDEDLAEMANGICDRLNLTSEERELSRKNAIYVSERARTGEAFLGTAAGLLEKFGPFDILRIDTLHAYLGADILDVAATARFLRNGLNPILQKFDCGNILNHHTPKPTNRDTSNWRTSDWMYSGAGNADLTNWARAALVIETTHAPDVFKFHAAKRGSRIGWCDEQGQTVYKRMFCWDKGDKIFWHEATAEDAGRVESSKPSAKDARREPGTEEDFLALVPPEGSINKYKLMENARAENMGEKRIGEKLARKYLADLLDEKMLFKWRIARPRTNPEIRISRHEQPLI